MIKKAFDENLTSDTDKNSHYLSNRRVPPPHSLLKWMTSTELNDDTLEVVSLKIEKIKVATITAII